MGVLLLALVFYWLVQGTASRKTNISEARNTLGRLQSQFLPVTLVNRILDPNDFAFVNAQREPRILHLLEAERQAIATYWLSHTRQQVKLLMAFHVKSARYDAKLAAPLEIRLALNYLAFLMACDAFQSLIWLRGPFYAARVARLTMIIAMRFCAVSERILAMVEAQAGLREAPGQTAGG